MASRTKEVKFPSGKQVLSGLQPTGIIHVGNYLGAIRQWVKLQKKNNCIFFLADYHAITVPYHPRSFRQSLLETTAVYLACGLNPQKSIIFAQSQVPAHTELAWLLNTLTPLGELRRMTQFKEKAKKHHEAQVNAGLLTYPVLQAADILLYKAEVVPVGEDQLQHLEFTRMLARKLKRRFNIKLPLPAPFLLPIQARIMSLTNPREKMSKSASSPRSYIALTDSPDTIREKVARAVTDSKKALDPNQLGPGVQNLLKIYAGFAEVEFNTALNQFAGSGYARLKRELACLLAEKLAPIRKRYQEYLQDSAGIVKLLERGAKRAEVIATRTLKEIKAQAGFLA
jgi:tryptophanyl-tRNA synthetase